MSNKQRHVFGLSIGKDSAALAVVLIIITEIPVEYYFTTEL